MSRLKGLGICTAAIAMVSLQPVQAATAATDTATQFHAIYSEEWAWRTADRKDLEQVDAGHQRSKLDYWLGVQRRLDGLDLKQLSPQDQVNEQIYATQIANLIADQRFMQWQMPFNSDSSFWADLPDQVMGGSLHTAADYQAYLDRLAEIPRYFDQQMANMRLGLARGFTVPRATLEGRDQSIRDFSDVSDPTQSRYFEPFKHMPSNWSQAEIDQWQARARDVISRQVLPAYRKLLDFFDHDYLPGARRTLAAESLPDGKAYYRQQIHEYTTLDLDPDTIHRMGLEQVAKLQEQMLQVMKSTGFKGSFAEFLQFLRTDPQFYAKSPDELLMRTAWVAKQVDAQLGHYFDHLPRQRFAIEPVPAAIAPYYTSGRGGPDVYMVNTYDLKSRGLYNMPALTLHESMPGHALQLALAAEQTDQPDFRRDDYISAYGEGWALYAEFLGNEMGIYTTPYQRFGYLSYQMWRACRLVVDTGIHHLGWTRQQAIDYLSAHTALSQREIVNEVDRYISWPGQALSYELGYLTIRKLRQQAEQALGARFDLRHFHDTVLSTGSVPLPILQQRIRQFIAEGGPEPDEADERCQQKKTPTG
ncbi:DUF885 domain-containing protein [Frateuria aurantia]